MKCFRYYYRGYKRERPIKISLFPENLDQKYFVQIFLKEKNPRKIADKTSENRKENCRKKFCTQKFSKKFGKIA